MSFYTPFNLAGKATKTVMDTVKPTVPKNNTQNSSTTFTPAQQNTSYDYSNPYDVASYARNIASKAVGAISPTLGKNMDTVMKGIDSANAYGKNVQYQTPQQQNPYADDYWAAMMGAITSNQAQQNANTISQLNAAYDQSRQGLQSQAPGIQQNANNLRNQNDTAFYTQYAPQMYAALEQSGGYRGGDMASGMQGLLTTRGQNLNDISLNEANQIQAINDAITQLDSQKAASLAQAQQGISSDSLNQMLTAAQGAQNAYQWQKEYDANAINDAYNKSVTDAGLTGYFKGQPTAATNQFNQNLALQEAGLTGYYNGKPTADTTQYNQQMAYQQQRDKVSDSQWQQQYNYQASRDKVLDDQWMKQFNTAQQQQILDNAYKNRQISLDEYQAKSARISAANSNSLGWAELQNQKNNQNYQQKQDATAQSAQAYNNITSQIDRLYTYTDIQGKLNVDKEGIISYIKNLEDSGVDPTTVDKLLTRYGLPKGR